MGGKLYLILIFILLIIGHFDRLFTFFGHWSFYSVIIPVSILYLFLNFVINIIFYYFLEIIVFILVPIFF